MYLPQGCASLLRHNSLAQPIPARLQHVQQVLKFATATSAHLWPNILQEQPAQRLRSQAGKPVLKRCTHVKYKGTLEMHVAQLVSSFDINRHATSFCPMVGLIADAVPAGNMHCSLRASCKANCSSLHPIAARKHASPRQQNLQSQH